MPIVRSSVFLGRTGFARAPGRVGVQFGAAPGGSTPPPFTLGVTPLERGVNVGAGVIRPYPTGSGGTVGSQTLTGTQVLQNRTINGNVSLGGNSQLLDCVVNGRVSRTDGTPLSENNLVRGTVAEPTGEVPLQSGGSNMTGYLISRYNDLVPQTPSAFWSGMGAKNYHSYHDFVDRCTDSFSAFSTTSDGICDIYVEAALSPSMVQFRPDYANGNRSHTHNDTNQCQGNLGDENDIIFIGCDFAALHATTGGTQPTQHAHKAAIMLTPNVQNKISGSWIDCWLRGGVYTFNGGDDGPSVAAGTGGTIKVTGCRFDRPGYGSNLNSQALVIDNRYTKIVSGNTFLDNGAAVPVMAY